MPRAALVSALGVLALALVFPGTACAEEEAEPYLHFGPAIVHASLAVGETYDDNVYATAGDARSDYCTTASGGLSLTLPGDTGELVLGASADTGDHREYSDLDWGDWSVYGRGVFVIRDRFRVEVGDRYASGHLVPLESTSGLLETYASNAASVALKYDFLDLWQLRLGYTRTTYDYDESDYRSRDEDLVSAALFFRAFPRTSIFAEYDTTDVAYEASSSTPDNREHGFSIGAAWEITEATRGTVEAGTRSVSFHDPDEEGWSTWGGSIDLQHELTARTTLSVRGDRSIEEGKYQGTRYISATGMGARLTWLVLDRLAATAGAGYYWEDFSDPNPGDATVRDDRTARASLGMRYSFRSWLQFSLDYRYLDRDSNIDHYDARENTFTAQATAQF
jgi:hypothetical protein